MPSATEQSTASYDELNHELGVLQRAYERERKRRRYAERMLEDKARELYEKLDELSQVNEALIQANTLLSDQTTIIKGLSSSYNRVTSDLKVAAKTQMDLLPPPIDIGAVAASGLFRPAEFIAGDGYDYFELADNLFAFYVLDVAGHGAAAAMVSFAAQVHLNPKEQGLCQLSVDRSHSLREAVRTTLQELNRIFYVDDGSVQYFTMVYGVLDLNSGYVSVGQAGHPPPLVYDKANGEIQQYGDGGHPIAMFKNPTFGVHDFSMNPGDRLVVYSDGVTECTRRSGEEFGEVRLAQAIEKSALAPLDQANDMLSNELIGWNSSDVFQDDLSILLIQYQGPPQEAKPEITS